MLYQCRICRELLELNEDNFYKSKSKLGFHTKCKECYKENARENNKVYYAKNSKEISAKVSKRYHENEYVRDARHKDALRRRDEGQFRNWRRKNKDRIKQYTIKRNETKKHNIKHSELLALYNYANNSCMYCGLSEEESLKIYKQRLHKDHAINNGSDSIDNCILACRSCNSSKGNKDWDVWYVVSNKRFDELRYKKIVKWLNSFTRETDVIDIRKESNANE